MRLRQISPLFYFHLSPYIISFDAIYFTLLGEGRLARKPVNHISWVAVITPTDRPKSVRNHCVIQFVSGGLFCVVTLPV